MNSDAEVPEGKIQIKPLSVNQAYQGRKIKSHMYRKYERETLALLPNDIPIPVKGDLQLIVLFGHSNTNFDYDNGIKPFQDILQKKYGFNDKRIRLGIIFKEHTKKGEEFIFFRIEKLKTKWEDLISECRRT